MKASGGNHGATKANVTLAKHITIALENLMVINLVTEHGVLMEIEIQNVRQHPVKPLRD